MDDIVRFVCAAINMTSRDRFVVCPVDLTGGHRGAIDVGAHVDDASAASGCFIARGRAGLGDPWDIHDTRVAILDWRQGLPILSVRRTRCPICRSRVAAVRLYAHAGYRLCRLCYRGATCVDAPPRPLDPDERDPFNTRPTRFGIYAPIQPLSPALATIWPGSAIIGSPDGATLTLDYEGGPAPDLSRWSPFEDRLLRAAGRHRHRLGTVARVGGVAPTAVVRLGAWDYEENRAYLDHPATDATGDGPGRVTAWTPTLTTRASLSDASLATPSPRA